MTELLSRAAVLHIIPMAFLFFFNDTATTEIYTLSLHDALPISGRRGCHCKSHGADGCAGGIESRGDAGGQTGRGQRSEEHTSELQSHSDLVCRLLLEKKKSAGRTGKEQRWCTDSGA